MSLSQSNEKEYVSCMVDERLCMYPFITLCYRSARKSTQISSNSSYSILYNSGIPCNHLICIPQSIEGVKIWRVGREYEKAENYIILISYNSSFLYSYFFSFSIAAFPIGRPNSNCSDDGTHKTWYLMAAT